MYDGFSVYIGSIILCLFLAFLSEKYVKLKNTEYVVHRVNGFFYFLSFLVITLAMGMTDTGVDYYNYYRIIGLFVNFSDVFAHDDVEYGFAFLSFCGNHLGLSRHVIIFLFKTLSSAVFFISFYLIKDRICVFIAVLAYLSIIYLQSYYLISIYMASSFVCLSFVLFVKKSQKTSIFCLIIAILFHYSAIMVFAVMGIYYFITKQQENDDTSISIFKFRTLIVSLFLFISIFLFAEIVSFFISMSSAFDHYAHYEMNTGTSNTGLFHIFRYLLPFTFIYLMYKKYERNEFIILSFCYALLGFAMTRITFGIFIRLFYIFFPALSLLIAYYFNIKMSSKNRIVIWTICIGYYLMNMYVSYIEILGDKSEADMRNYHYINPFEL